jgi:hypothetical protein
MSLTPALPNFVALDSIFIRLAEFNLTGIKLVHDENLLYLFCVSESIDNSHYLNFFQNKYENNYLSCILLPSSYEAILNVEYYT